MKGAQRRRMLRLYLGDRQGTGTHMNFAGTCCALHRLHPPSTVLINDLSSARCALLEEMPTGVSSVHDRGT